MWLTNVWCSFSPDGSKIATAGSDKRVYIYDGKSGEKISVLAGEKEVRRSAGGGRAVETLGSHDNSCGQGGHTAGIYSVSWNGASTKVLTASADKTARVFDVASGKCETTFTFAEKADTEHQQLGCLWLGEHMLSVSLAGVVSYLDAANPSKPKRVVYGHSKTVTALAYDAAAGTFFSGDAAGVVIRWDVATAANVALANTHGNQLKRLVLDGDNLVSTAMDDTVRIAKRASPTEFTAS